MYGRIAVPIDADSDSELAIPLAVDIARRADCPLDIVTAIGPPASALGTDFGGAATGLDMVFEVREAAAERLHKIVESLAAKGIEAAQEVLDGSAPYALAEYFDKTRTELVVMTTHDRGRLERLLLGSVASEVVRHSHVPSLLVHVKEGKALLPDTIGRILVPLDGSEFGEQVLPHATRLAALMGADVTLLSVLQPVLASVAIAPSPVVAPMAVPAPDDDVDEVQRGTLESALERAAGQLRAQGVDAQTALVDGGQPAKAIVEYAQKHHVDLIAMTTHGRGALKRLVAGSVAQKVLRTSRMPMLMYRPRPASAAG